MIIEICKLIYERRDFFINLCLEHLTISFIAIVVSIFLGGLIGICVSEFQRSSKVVIPAINFLYTIP